MTTLDIEVGGEGRKADRFAIIGIQRSNFYQQFRATSTCERGHIILFGAKS